MDETKRTTVTMDILDWLEEDTKKELRDEERKKYANLRAEYIKMKSVAVSEMYRAIEDINDNRDNCFLALGKAHLCYRLGLISKKAYCEIHDYLKRKTRDQNDWKALYEDLRQHYQRELMESEYWTKEYQNLSSKLEQLKKQDEKIISFDLRNRCSYLKSTSK